MNTYCGDRSSCEVPIALQDAMGQGLFASTDCRPVALAHCIDPLQKRATVIRSNGRPEQRVPLRLRRPHLREASADFGLIHLVTTSMNNPGWAQSIL